MSITDKISPRLLEELGEGQSARFYLKGNTKRPLAFKWSSKGEKRGDCLEERRIIEACDKKPKVILVEDSETAPIMQRLGTPYFRSCLCIPMFDSHKLLIGAIFLTSPDPGSFTEAELSKWQKTAEELTPIIEEQTRIEVKDSNQGRGFVRNVLFSPAAGLVVVCALVFGAMLMNAPKQEAPKARLTATEVAQRFHTSLSKKDYTSAWVLLEPKLRKRWPGRDFSNSWEESGVELGQSKLGTVEESEAQAVALVSAPSGESWRWTLVEDRKSWYVSRLQGPVDSPTVE